MIFGGAKMIMAGILIAGLAGGAAYVYKLKADNEILKANQIKLEEAVNDQKAVIKQQKEDFGKILEANKQMNVLVSALKKDLTDLDKRFNKKKRDIGKLAIERTESIQRITNSASDRATRCIEIAMGSPLTEKEIKATLKSEINTECPSIANPNYVEYAN
jgi:hypothetical protein